MYKELLIISQELQLKSVFKQNTVIGSLFHSPKAKLPGMKTSGVGEIPKACGQSLIGQTRRVFEIHMKERVRDVEY